VISGSYKLFVVTFLSRMGKTIEIILEQTEPVISENRALLLSLFAILAFIIGIALLSARRKSMYPALTAAAISFCSAFWIAVSIGVDRATDPFTYVYCSRLTYVFPLFGLSLFVLFGLQFPPTAKKRTVLIAGLALAAVAMFFSVIAMHPNGYVVDYSLVSKAVFAVTHAPFYWIMISSFFFLVGIGVGTFAKKWRRLEQKEKRAVFLICVSLVLTTIISAGVSIVNALVSPTSNLYQYSYPSILIFLITLTYVIMKYGALGVAVTFPRSLWLIIVTGVVSLLLLIAFT
jgi:hypothetical protein